jgi:hypothetical protein
MAEQEPEGTVQEESVDDVEGQETDLEGGQEDSAQEATVDPTESEEYQTLQSQYTKVTQEAQRQAEINQMLMRQMDSRQQPSEPAEEFDPDEPVTKGELKNVLAEKDKRIGTLEARLTGRELVEQFRARHPDLKEFEDNLVKPILLTMRNANPNLSREELVEQAANVASGVVKKIQSTAGDNRDAKKKAAAAAGGLASAGNTPPQKEESKGESPDEYLAKRKERLRQMRGDA